MTIDLDTLPQRLRAMIARLVQHAALINQYPSGSLELHFTRDEKAHESVKLKVKELILPS